MTTDASLELVTRIIRDRWGSELELFSSEDACGIINGFGVCVASVRALAEELNVSTDTIRRAVTAL